MLSSDSSKTYCNVLGQGDSNVFQGGMVNDRIFLKINDACRNNQFFGHAVVIMKASLTVKAMFSVTFKHLLQG